MSEYIINEDILNFGKAVLPLVSFVIPYYKPSINYIKEMLDSILPVALKYGNSEILLHNDGTNDASISALVTEYAERYPKLFRLSEIFPNCGISLSRQILVERAHGKYLLSFDADDVMLAFDLAAEIDYMEKNPEVGATYSLKYFFKGEREYTNIGAMPPSPFVSTFSMTAVPNGALIKREAVMNCGGYANIAPGLGDDVILFSRLGERYRCELRGTPRVMGRCHENSFASKTDFAGYKGYYQDIRARLLRRPLEVRMLENFQIPDLPDFQVLALAGGIFYVRQSQIDFTLKFLAFLVSRYPYDFGLQNIYMTFLLKYRRFEEFDSHWQKLDTFGNNFLFSSAMWLSSLAEIAQQVGHPQPRLNEINIALQNYLSNLPPQVKDFLKR